LISYVEYVYFFLNTIYIGIDKGDNMLKINMEFRKGILFVRLIGNLDEYTLEYFKKEVSDFILENGLKYIVLNLKELKYIDSKGINQLTKDFQSISSSNGQVVICGVEEKTYKKDLKYYTYTSPNELNAFQLIQV